MHRQEMAPIRLGDLGRWLLGLLLAAMAAVGLPGAEPGPWRKYVAPGLTLYANASPQKAQQVASRSVALLEDYRRLALFGAPSPPESATVANPVRLVLFADFASYLPYRMTTDAPAFHIGGMGRSLVLLQDLPQDLDEVLTHELFHVYTEQAGVRLPVWAAEGLADYFATMRREADAEGAQQLVLGEALPRHTRLLRESDGQLETHQLFRITAEDRYRGGQPQAVAFYARCWLVAHMLMSDLRWRAQLPDFLRLLGERTAEEALGLVYAAEPGAFDEAAARYLAAGQFATQRVEAPAVRPAVVTEEPMPAWELPLLLADVLSYRGRQEAAHHRYLALREEFPQVAQIHESLAQLALARERMTEAAEHFEEAACWGSMNAEVYFRLATLRCGMQSEDPRCLEWLERAVRLDAATPEFRHYAVDFALNMKQFTTALRWMAGTSRIHPSRRFEWLHQQAYARYHLSDFDGARDRLSEARALPLHAGQQKMLRDLERAIQDREEFTLQMELLRDASQQGDESQRVALGRILENFARQPHAVLESGQLHEVRCDASPLALLVDTASGRRRLRVQDPMDLMVLDGSRRMRELELTCGPASDAEVRVGYLWHEGQWEGTLRVLQFQPAGRP